MRILHTADWQLGLRAAQAGERAREVRAERLAAVERIVVLAHELEVDAVLVAGDVFDRQDVDDSMVRGLLDRLERLAPIPVVLLPGNHDPFVVGGVWTRSSWSEVGSHVTVATESAEIEPVPGLAVYPCVLSQKRSRQDPTAWIPNRRAGDSRLRVGLAHGSLDSLGVTGSNFPIARDRIELCDLDYLALGDWHGVSIQGRAAYPGTPEATAFAEKLPGYVLVVDLDDERKNDPKVEQHRVGRFVWLELSADLRDRTDVERLEEQIRTAARPENLLLRAELRLQSTDGALMRELDSIRARLEDSLFVVDWRQQDRSLEDDLPEGLLAEADEALAALLAGDPHQGVLDGIPEKVVDAEPAVLAEARAVLRRVYGDALADSAETGEAVGNEASP